MKKLTRTLSGVAPIAVMMKPYPCPHGRCIYCPSINSPNSYTETSAPVLRARRHGYDPYRQVIARLETYRLMGHDTSKCELIIMGGTFFGYPEDYRRNFVKSCFDALNGKISSSIEEAHALNEKAKHRCVALCIETRPDFCGEKEINELLEIGCTRVELGVQTLDEKVYEIVERGHSIKDVIKATQLLKDSAFKVYYHFMPGLFSTPEKDLKMFKELFKNQNFMPDGLKIYPTLVVKETKLAELWQQGEFKPYTLEETIRVVAKLKEIVPEWVRISRIMRAIPKEHILAGPERSDLRYLIKLYMKERGMKCRCIRCREAGYREREGIRPENIELKRRDYKASKGKEVFLSFEDEEKDVLIGILRLRIPYKPFRPEITEDTALIREIHVYGKEVAIGKRSGEAYQHKGYGKRLMEEAERIAKEEFGCRKMIVIAGVGARE
jgi:elongator complex protein 3